jgi:hypothetical protein
MGKETYDLGDGAYVRPADESIDEALARLARQDSRTGADGSIIPTSTTEAGTAPTTDAVPARFAALQNALPQRVRPTAPPPIARRPPQPSRASGIIAPPVPTTPTRRRGALPIVRWLIILGATWFFFRYIMR